MANIQGSYMSIQTLFDDKTQRTVDALQTIYDDHDKLVYIIENICGKELTEERIRDKRVLLKPNWVKHSYNFSDEICLRTHDNFLMAILEFVLSKKPSSVIIGDAPIQGCKWNEMIKEKFFSSIELLSSSFNIPILVKDFRRVIYNVAANNVQTGLHPISDYIIFDIGKRSYLEPVTGAGKNLFRVSQYNPDKFKETHQPGVHKYCITKDLFNADIVISLPKVKTHEKTGITCALKNIVGLNGDKDFLPHHRVGGTKKGGDSYPGKNFLRYWAELALDNANRDKGERGYWFWRRLSTVLWKVSLPGKHHQLNAAWYGNDTTWRMVMDLNMIINFGKADGTLAAEPQRFLYNICDGIIGGQGNGPLKPDPLNLGVISFSNDSAITDLCMATLMGMDIEKLPLLSAAKSFMPGRNTSVSLNGDPVTLEDLKQYAVRAELPPGWRN